MFLFSQRQAMLACRKSRRMQLQHQNLRTKSHLACSDKVREKLLHALYYYTPKAGNNHRLPGLVGRLAPIRNYLVELHAYISLCQASFSAFRIICSAWPTYSCGASCTRFTAQVVHSQYTIRFHVCYSSEAELQVSPDDEALVSLVCLRSSTMVVKFAVDVFTTLHMP